MFNIFLSRPTENQSSTSDDSFQETEAFGCSFLAGIITAITSVLALIFPFLAPCIQAYATMIQVWSVILNIGVLFGSICAVFSCCCCCPRIFTSIYVFFISVLSPFIFFFMVYEILFGIYTLRYNDTDCYGEVDYSLIKRYPTTYAQNMEEANVTSTVAFFCVTAGLNFVTFIVGQIYLLYVTFVHLFGKISSSVRRFGVFIQIVLFAVMYLCSFGYSLFGNVGESAFVVFRVMNVLGGVFLLVMIFFILFFICCSIFRDRYYLVHNVFVIGLILLVILALVNLIVCIVFHAGRFKTIDNYAEENYDDVSFYCFPKSRNNTEIYPNALKDGADVVKKNIKSSMVKITVINIILQVFFFGWIQSLCTSISKSVLALYQSYKFNRTETPSSQNQDVRPTIYAQNTPPAGSYGPPSSSPSSGNVVVLPPPS